ncbi:MAG: hypothetical protein Q9227_001774 [Pyrenula ochraceoflavens]
MVFRKFRSLRKSAALEEASPPPETKKDPPKPPDPPPRCNVCRNHDWTREESIIYETNAQALEESARGKCQLCPVLWSGITQLIPAVGENPQPAHYIRFWPGKGGLPLRLRVGGPDEHPKLEYFTIEGAPSPRSAFGPARQISPHSGSERCRFLMAEWLDDCVSNHQECSKGAEVLPTRLLLIGEGAPGSPLPSVRLYEPSDERVDYATLSHCWGGRIPMMTTKDNLQDRKIGIRFEQLPKTFQDAILTTRSLGLQCLWIDSLCIAQDDPREWAQEIAKMKDIFSGSFVTLASSWSGNSMQGCFSTREAEERVVWQSRYRTADGIQPKIFARRVIGHKVARKQPLNSRAWAYQEHLLSRRIIHFLPEEVRWECRKSSKCECSVRETDLSRGDVSHENWSTGTAPLPSDALRHCYSTWHSIVSEYSSRALSDPADKLPAIAGLAALTKSVCGSRYVAGLWTENLVNGLLWTCVNAGIVGSRSRTYRAPSWSWASMDGTVQYNTWPLPRFENTCRLLSGKCDAIGPDPFGRVSSGDLVIRGLTVQAVVDVDQSNNSNYENSHTRNTFRAWLLRDDLRAEFAADESISLTEQTDSSRMVLCLQLGHSTDYQDRYESTVSLVLIPSRAPPSSPSQSPRYERIGVLHHTVQAHDPGGPQFVYGQDWFHDAEEKAITII